jgi:hypothetical protein
MARDAISRQYDVDKNKVTLTCEEGKSYRPGIITFTPKPGKSLDLRKIEESIRATRLSGGTNMSVDYLEITAAGDLVIDDKTAVLKVAGSAQQFALKEAGPKDGAKASLQGLRDALASGAQVVRVTGRVDGWKGPFPVVLRGLAQKAADAPMGLVVTDFEIGKKQLPP